MASVEVQAISLVVIVVLFALGLLKFYFFRKAPSKWIEEPKDEVRPQPNPAPPTIITQQVDLTPLIKALEEVPRQVLQTIQSSTNTYKGHLGELMGYISLRAQYDRIIPLGNIVDFMCIKLPKDGNPGQID